MKTISRSHSHSHSRAHALGHLPSNEDDGDSDGDGINKTDLETFDAFEDEGPTGTEMGVGIRTLLERSTMNPNVNNPNANPNANPNRSFWLLCGDLHVLALMGLVVAGLAGTLVADVFGMFYVDCFLRAYRLPLRVFGIGSAIFAVINTANDVAGAYFIDWYASSVAHRRRDELVGWSGCLLALTFLLPFFRWDHAFVRNSNSNIENDKRQWFWDGLHFVGSLSIYDTLFSFNCILQGSIVFDNHSMQQNQRIAFFVCRDLVGILAPLVVTKIGLSLFDVENLGPFRRYAVILALVSSGLALVGQGLINTHRIGNDDDRNVSANVNATLTSTDTDSNTNTDKATAEARRKKGGKTYSRVDSDVSDLGSSDPQNDNFNNNNDEEEDESTLRFWRVVRDFAAHPNFRYWIAMEMLMEMQNTFVGNFQKTFVDQLLLERSNGVDSYVGDGDGDGDSTLYTSNGWSRGACDWLLALLDPATQLVGLLLFLPVQKYGYARMYTVVFATNIVLAGSLLLARGLGMTESNSDDNGSNADADPVWPVAAFLVALSVFSNAMAGTGFGLAMCDMVLEMKHSHSVVQGRSNPPSLAGLFMGVNALFCKPAESILPILTASFLGDSYNQDGSGGAGDGVTNEPQEQQHARVVLYRLLVIPPLVCSTLQLLVWSRYSLVPERTERLRTELENWERQTRVSKQERGQDQEHSSGAFQDYRDDDYQEEDIEMKNLANTTARPSSSDHRGLV